MNQGKYKCKVWNIVVSNFKFIGNITMKIRWSKNALLYYLYIVDNGKLIITCLKATPTIEYATTATLIYMISKQQLASTFSLLP